MFSADASPVLLATAIGEAHRVSMMMATRAERSMQQIQMRNASARSSSTLLLRMATTDRLIELFRQLDRPDSHSIVSLFLRVCPHLVPKGVICKRLPL